MPASEIVARIDKEGIKKPLFRIAETFQFPHQDPAGHAATVHNIPSIRYGYLVIGGERLGELLLTAKGIGQSA